MADDAATIPHIGTAHDDDGGETIDLEPSLALDAGSAPTSPTMGHVAMVEGTHVSLGHETEGLRRSRLLAVSAFLAVCYGLVFAWHGLDREPDRALILVLVGLRFAVAAGATAFLASRAATGRPEAVRAVEFGLFATITALVACSQYFVNLDLLRRGDLVGMVVYEKNGVFQVVVLMVLYGMFIPNDARTAAKVVLTLPLLPMVAVALMLERAEALPHMHRLVSEAHIGSNVVSLLVGAALSIYGAHVLNRLRTQLHAARRFGQYQLRERLGEGGMGEVFLAEHQLLKRPCALKIIRPDATHDPIALARFEREVRSAAQLSHPNTIEIFDYGHADDGTFYYVMEYLPGLSLGDLVRSHGPLAPGRVVYLLRQVCAGLAEAHALGLIHRDLKPANVFVAMRGGEFDVAKVLDFGLVKLTLDAGSPELTADRTVSGTPLFMAPEQAAGDPGLDARADIYALGAIAYYALTGRPPFSGASAVAVMIAHARDPVVPPSQVRPGVPGDLEAVVLRCLAKRPEDRYPDVKALGRALAACASAAEWDADRAEAWWREAE